MIIAGNTGIGKPKLLKVVQPAAMIILTSELLLA